MNFEAFDLTEIEANKKQYATEVKERWGKTAAYAQSKEKTSNYDSDKWQMISGESQDILKAFAHNRDNDPESEIAQALVKGWQDYITAHFYDCTKEILSCLGLMYVSDERFKENIDKNGEGTARFMAKAIAFYCMD